MEQERIKERHSFRLGWVRLDLTVTKTLKYGKGTRAGLVIGGGELSYEVELEVEDIDWLVRQAKDSNHFLFQSAIRRYIQNAASLSHVLARSRMRAKEEFFEGKRKKEREELMA